MGGQVDGYLLFKPKIFIPAWCIDIRIHGTMHFHTIDCRCFSRPRNSLFSLVLLLLRGHLEVLLVLRRVFLPSPIFVCCLLLLRVVYCALMCCVLLRVIYSCVRCLLLRVVHCALRTNV